LFYRFNNDLEFAFSLSLQKGLNLPQFVAFNTFQPSQNSDDFFNQVANWVQVTNVSQTVGEGYLFLYDSSGVLLNDGGEFLRLEAGQRHDIAAHAFGASRVGMAEWRPSGNNASFLLRNIRYYYDNSFLIPSFDTAVQMTGAYGSGRDQYMIVDTENALSVVEIINTLAVEVESEFKLRDENGILLFTGIVEIPAKGSFHYIVNQHLPSGQKGSVEVKASDPNAIIAHALQYVQKANLGIEYISSLPAEQEYHLTLNGEYNTFIGQDAELVILNTRSASSNGDWNLSDSLGNSLFANLSFSTLPKARTSIDVDALVSDDSYGGLTLESDVLGSYVAWIVRERSPSYNIPISLKP